MLTQPLTFIGAGNMAQSLIRGLINGGADAGLICASDPAPEQRERLRDALPEDAASKIRLESDNARAVSGSDVIVLAVKPQVLEGVALELGPALTAGQLIVSIAAGVPTDAIAQWCGDRAIVRAMPNTPALLGAGATALFANARTSAVQREIANEILSAAGFVAWVDEESKLDAVTALSGSGPAYFFFLMEAMIDAGEALGLERALAERLTLETALGAARMAREGTTPPSQLRHNVTSPGGTTERALSILEEGGARRLIEQALAGAAARSQELAREFGGKRA